MERTVYATAYGRAIAIETHGIEVALPYLPFPWESTRPNGELDRIYRLHERTGGKYSLVIDQQSAIDVLDLHLLGDLVEGDLHHWLATFTRGYLFVHAGCVAWRGRGIVLPGRTHVGKSTLTHALIESGATYYSDDYAVIDPSGAIWPFPRRLHIRPITAAPPHRIDPVTREWEIGRTAMRAVLVADLRFDREQGWAVERLSGGQGALSLLDNTVAARERPQDALRMMSNLMMGTVAIKGTRDSAEDTAQRLLTMVDQLLDQE